MNARGARPTAQAGSFAVLPSYVQVASRIVSSP